jgi:hypothetical protein
MTMSDFDADRPPDEREDLERVAARLVASRPVPRPTFRGELRRTLSAAPRRRALRLQAVAYLASGAALLTVAALGVNGIGPLAPTPLAESGVTAHISGR